MRQLLFAACAAAILASCGKKQNGEFELKGQFTDTNGEMLYLEKLNGPQPVIVDSTTVDEEGKFEFENYRPKIGFYRIKVSPQNFAMLVLDSADKVTLSGSIKDLGNTYKAEGSKETSLFVEYNEISKRNRSQLDSLNMAFQTVMQTMRVDSLRMDSLSRAFQQPFDRIMERFNEEMAAKISKNTDMYASIMAIQGMEPEKYGDLYRALDAGLTKKYPNDKTVRTFREVVKRILGTAVGVEAPEISLPSPDGTEIALSSLRGKVVLIDFWASWCGPCRKEMPNVVKAYNKYKDKGFEIYGVSLDQDRERWVEAIRKDGITWPQVSDLKYWESDVVPLYGIQGIPYTVLLDKDGKILAKGLRGPDLDKAIENALAGKPVKQS